MSDKSRRKKVEQEDLSISIDEIVVEKERDDQPDFVRVKYTNKARNKVLGHTRVIILAD